MTGAKQLEAPKTQRLGGVLKNYRSITGIPDKDIDALVKAGATDRLNGILKTAIEVRTRPRPQGSYDLQSFGDKVFVVERHSGAYKETPIKPGKDKDDLMAGHQFYTEARQQNGCAQTHVSFARRS